MSDFWRDFVSDTVADRYQFVASNHRMEIVYPDSDSPASTATKTRFQRVLVRFLSYPSSPTHLRGFSHTFERAYLDNHGGPHLVHTGTLWLRHRSQGRESSSGDSTSGREYGTGCPKVSLQIFASHALTHIIEPVFLKICTRRIRISCLNSFRTRTITHTAHQSHRRQLSTCKATS